MIQYKTICCKYLYTKYLNLVTGFELIKYFHFPIAKMSSNYVVTGNANKLEAALKQVPLVQIFRIVHNIFMNHK